MEFSNIDISGVYIYCIVFHYDGQKLIYNPNTTRSTIQELLSFIVENSERDIYGACIFARYSSKFVRAIKKGEDLHRAADKWREERNRRGACEEARPGTAHIADDNKGGLGGGMRSVINSSVDGIQIESLPG